MKAVFSRLQRLRVLTDRWQTLSARERRLVAIGLASISALVLVSVGESLAREHARLREALPRLQAQQQAVAAAAAEISSLQARSPDAGTTSGAINALPALAELAGTRGLSLELVRVADGELRFEGRGEATALLDWLAEAHAAYGAQPIGLAVRTREGPDDVSGQLRLHGSD